MLLGLEATLLRDMLEVATIPFPVLPEVLICEILLRLPVRSLLQCKCVCKSWKILISDSEFIKNHFRISTSDPTMTNQQLVFSFRKQPGKIVSYALKPLLENTATSIKLGTYLFREETYSNIIGSCNGLLCLLDNFSRCYVRLCNPSLGLISNRSSIPVSEDWYIVHYGFGYDQVNDKYKVLLVVQIKGHIFTKIHTFGYDDGWKTISNFPCDLDTHYGKFVSGTMNWLVSNKNTFLSLHVENETYIELLLPQNNVNKKMYSYRALSVLNNCLCVSESDNFHWVLWVMKEYGIVESWTKFIIIPHDNLIHNVPYSVEPLFISQDGVLMVLIDSELILYNSNSGVALITFKGLGIRPHLHCESLISLPCLFRINIYRNAAFQLFSTTSWKQLWDLLFILFK
ncbi:F-box/kelch-repeat protein At3g23880-like [Vicia villosa]|uniref:F-box/kelch-repeat protein At3g23880-like n=1 Tax=Vicia villosa TaxID=3911 RepID=UPI00273C3BB8|nr:F-box/kelch-repeat protein At3g23880-like [Vicia villosa]